MKKLEVHPQVFLKVLYGDRVASRPQVTRFRWPRNAWTRPVPFVELKPCRCGYHLATIQALQTWVSYYMGYGRRGLAVYAAQGRGGWIRHGRRHTTKYVFQSARLGRRLYYHPPDHYPTVKEVVRRVREAIVREATIKQEKESRRAR